MLRYCAIGLRLRYPGYVAFAVVAPRLTRSLYVVTRYRCPVDVVVRWLVVAYVPLHDYVYRLRSTRCRCIPTLYDRLPVDLDWRTTRLLLLRLVRHVAGPICSGCPVGPFTLPGWTTLRLILTGYRVRWMRLTGRYFAGTPHLHSGCWLLCRILRYVITLPRLPLPVTVGTFPRPLRTYVTIVRWPGYTRCCCCSL